MEVDEDHPETQEATKQLSLSDKLRRIPSIQLPSKPKSQHVVLGNGGELRVVTTLANNTITLHSVQVGVKSNKPNLLRSISNQGHHSEVRAVTFSSDNLVVVSGSAESIKIWNRPTQTCIRTVQTG